MRNAGWLGTRWLGVGLAAIVSVVTIALALTDRLALYINPDASWFAVGMSVVVLVGTALSFTLPLGAEADHGHDHGDHGGHRGDERVGAPSARERSLEVPRARSQGAGPRARSQDEGRDHHDRPAHHARPAALTASVLGGVAASGIVLATLLLPPASLSAELAMSRDVGAPPLFAGADAVTLAATGDTSSFGVGDWSAVFATATNPDAFDGEAVTLTGFVTPGADADGFALTRLVITHCVIDAQTASVPIAASASAPAPGTGQWVTVVGTVRSTVDGRLSIVPASVEWIDEPGDPYEY